MARRSPRRCGSGTRAAPRRSVPAAARSWPASSTAWSCWSPVSCPLRNGGPTSPSASLSRWLSIAPSDANPRELLPAHLPPGDPTRSGPRLGARVLLLDADDRMLLLRAHDPAEPDRRWWELPGGGLQPSETTVQACQRELAEETGIELDPNEVGPCVWVRETRFRFRGRRYHR